MPSNMGTEGSNTAQTRIDAALRRIEAALGQRPDTSAADQRMAELAGRHASLRSDVQRALDDLNSLIAGEV